jgi:hypothetical protein
MTTRRVAVVAGVCLLLAAGCTAPTSETASPPGLSADGVTDPSELVRTHTDTLQSQSFTVHTTSTMRGPEGEYRVVSNRTWRLDPTDTVRGHVVSTSRTVGDAPAQYDARPDEVSTWRAGSTTYRRVRTGDDATYRRVAPFNSSVKLSAALQRQAIYRLHTRTNATVEPVSRNGRRLYRVAAALNDTAVTTNASLTMLVDADGVVRRLRTTQTVRYRSGTRVITRTVRITDVGSTTVDRPDWYPTAVAETGEPTRTPGAVRARASDSRSS